MMRLYVLIVLLVAQIISPSQGRADENTCLCYQSETQDKRLYKTLNLRVNGGPNLMTSSISGTTGLDSSVPTTFGGLYGAEIHYEPDTLPLEFFGKYQVFSVRHMDMRSVTPDDFNQKQTHSHLGFLIHEPVSQEEGFFRAGLGYFFDYRSGSLTSPSVTNNSSVSGPSIMFGYVNWLDNKFFYETDIVLMFPSAVKESPTTTGAFRYGKTVLASLHVVFPYTKELDLVTGLLFKYDLMLYSGQGDRGVTNGREDFYNFGIPFELRFRF